MFRIDERDKHSDVWFMCDRILADLGETKKIAHMVAMYRSILVRVVDESTGETWEFDGRRDEIALRDAIGKALESGPKASVDPNAHPLINRLVDLHETDDPYRGTVTYVDATGLMLAVPNYEERTYSTFFPWSRVQRVTVVDQ